MEGAQYSAETALHEQLFQALALCDAEGAKFTSRAIIRICAGRFGMEL